MSRPVGPSVRPAATARSVALRALVEIGGSGRANVVLPELLGRCELSERDRAFATELVYGTVRRLRACDWLAHRHVRRSLDADIRAAVRLGTYQLGFLGTPAHAAVSATVAEVRGPGRGLVNAVLRRVADDLAAGPVRWPDLATELSYPDWIVSSLTEDLGQASAEAALRAMNEPASMTVRPDGYVQDLASQWVTAAVAGGAGDRPARLIADLCAGPGGKATGLAYGVRDGAVAWPAGAVCEGANPTRPLVVAVDVDAHRAGVVQDNAGSLGLANVAVVIADGRRPPVRQAAFDRALVDAPCSGLGVLRRRPDARWRIQAADVGRLAGLQRVLLEAAIPLVRPGGLLVYSVCTLTRAETAGIDQWLARAHPEARPVLPSLDPAWERVGRGARLLPQTAGTDGMFLLALRLGEAGR
jgi:16S rRNA (cytosine967-C5)-methyltransferase